jgi:hypothetical protein
VDWANHASVKDNLTRFTSPLTFPATAMANTWCNPIFPWDELTVPAHAVAHTVGGQGSKATAQGWICTRRGPNPTTGCLNTSPAADAMLKHVRASYARDEEAVTVARDYCLHSSDTVVTDGHGDYLHSADTTYAYPPPANAGSTPGPIIGRGCCPLVVHPHPPNGPMCIGRTT